jgi:hypothetical protein
LNDRVIVVISSLRTRRELAVEFEHGISKGLGLGL